MQGIADLVAICMAQSSPERPTARLVFEVIRDTMMQHQLPSDDSAMEKRGGSLKAEIIRRQSMREALQNL